MKQLTGALVCADHDRPTVSLPADVAAAVVTYQKAALRVAALSDLADLAEAGIELSDMHADDLAHAEDLMAGARAALAKAGRLDLIGGA
ncbi:MAG: hypothetical protein ACJ71Y_11240 [Blastococcus sp.]